MSFDLSYLKSRKPILNSSCSEYSNACCEIYRQNQADRYGFRHLQNPEDDIYAMNACVG